MPLTRASSTVSRSRCVIVISGPRSATSISGGGGASGGGCLAGGAGGSAARAGGTAISAAKIATAKRQARRFIAGFRRLHSSRARTPLFARTPRRLEVQHLRAFLAGGREPAVFVEIEDRLDDVGGFLQDLH